MSLLLAGPAISNEEIGQHTKRAIFRGLEMERIADILVLAKRTMRAQA